MSRRSRERGFILLIALAVLGIVGVAMLVLAAATAYDARRSIERSQRAQLDQMLLAGASEARERLKTASPKTGDSWDVELPKALTEQSATMHSTVSSIEQNGEVYLLIHATLSNRSAEQTVRFSQASGDWKLISAKVSL